MTDYALFNSISSLNVSGARNVTCAFVINPDFVTNGVSAGKAHAVRRWPEVRNNVQLGLIFATAPNINRYTGGGPRDNS
jgi:hypothetical protein